MTCGKAFENDHQLGLNGFGTACNPISEDATSWIYSEDYFGSSFALNLKLIMYHKSSVFRATVTNRRKQVL